MLIVVGLKKLKKEAIYSKNIRQKRKVTVPMQGGDIPKGILHSIIMKQAG